MLAAIAGRPALRAISIGVAALRVSNVNDAIQLFKLSIFRSLVVQTASRWSSESLLGGHQAAIWLLMAGNCQRAPEQSLQIQPVSGRPSLGPSRLLAILPTLLLLLLLPARPVHAFQTKLLIRE